MKYSTLIYQIALTVLVWNVPVGIDAQIKKDKRESFILFTDNRKMTGLRIKDDIKTNATSCIVLIKDDTERNSYTCDEVSEYQINKNNYYKAFDLRYQINEQRRFLYRVTKTDSTSFYRLYEDGKDRFFLERDGELKELVNEKRENGVSEYQYLLYQAFPENPWKLREMRNLKLNNHSLEIFADRVNADKWKPLNFLCYGLNITRTGLISEEESSTSISAFLDNPLSTTDFYLQYDLSYQSAITSKGVIAFVYINYSIPTKFVRPFIGLPFAGVSMGIQENRFVMAPFFNLLLDGWQTGIKVPLNNKIQFYLSQQIWRFDDLQSQTKFGFGVGF